MVAACRVPAVALGVARRRCRVCGLSSAGDAALQIEGGEYAMLFPDGYGGWEVADSGRFEVQGNTLAVQSSDGEILQYQFPSRCATIGAQRWV